MLTRWSDLDQTFPVLDEFQRRMSRLFEDLEPARWQIRPMTAGTWPAINLYDGGDELILRAMVPGLDEKEINITLNQEVLTLSGERKVEVPEGYSVHRQERGALSFSRSLTFPCKIDPDKTSAAVKDGILTIKLAKAAEAKPRQIEVKAQ